MRERKRAKGSGPRRRPQPAEPLAGAPKARIPQRTEATGPKSSFELAMERLRAADQESGTTEAPVSPAQKKEIAEARRVAASRLAEREILFLDAMKKTNDPAEREKAEREYQIDRQRINADCERSVESIRRPPTRGRE